MKEWRYVSVHLWFGFLMEGSDERQAPAALSLSEGEITYDTHCAGGWVRPCQYLYGCCEVRARCPSREPNPDYPVAHPCRPVTTELRLLTLQIIFIIISWYVEGRYVRGTSIPAYCWALYNPISNVLRIRLFKHMKKGILSKTDDIISRSEIKWDPLIIITFKSCFWVMKQCTLVTGNSIWSISWHTVGCQVFCCYDFKFRK
jgi:hypothetical protein